MLRQLPHPMANQILWEVSYIEVCLRYLKARFCLSIMYRFSTLTSLPMKYRSKQKQYQHILD
ncbi:unnamed protein product [Meloidogyne enterolobii]|uniref:Uncharacterized protein n=1 Tax=Meloidogyne enterolobii TaxID=390850 RepID=A0ACB1AD36_MELEN